MYDKKANSTLSGPPQGQTSIFRVQLHKDKPTEPVYHSRRAHQKSRSGCWTCKRRRVKCDETKPHCKRCQKYGIECDYAALQRYPRQTRGLISEFLERLPYLTALDSNGYSMALQAAAEKIDELLQVKPSKDRARYDGLMALHYFHSHGVTNPGQNVPPVVKAKLMDLGIQSPFVMHAMIATTTTHLCHIVPDNSAYKAIAAYHWREAVSQYSDALSTNVGPETMDALISGCLLLTMNSFMLEEFNPRSSFVFSTNPESLNWLMLQSGLRHLLYLTRPWFPQSIWFESFMASRGDEDTYEDHRPGRVGMDPEMADLCGIEESTVEETNPYWWPLRMLAHIVPLERSIKSFSRYTNFMGRLMPEYYQKLLQKDPPALVILAWWLALMSYMPVWWINTRVRSECVAICIFLENSPDPRVLRLLEFPAEACGYLLTHVRERDVLGSCMDVVQEV